MPAFGTALKNVSTAPRTYLHKVTVYINVGWYNKHDDDDGYTN